MMAAGATLRAVFTVFSAITMAVGVNVPCPAGTRVYSLSVWSGFWLDGMVMRCTGDSDEQNIPAELDEDGGGEEDKDICAGTAGVQSVHWNVQDGIYGLVYLNVTCLDNENYRFADDQPTDYWNITGNKTIFCDEGEYVRGLTYELDYLDDSTFPYILTDLGFMCSSSTLDPICTDCSGDTTLLLIVDEDQPEYCVLPICSDVECCEAAGDEEAESFTLNVIIGVVSTVLAGLIVSATAWTFHKFKNRHSNVKGMEGFRVEAAPSGRTAPVGSMEGS